jgi:hypothetical protein
MNTNATETSKPLPPAWMLTAKLVEQERDSGKLAKLVEQLCRELDAHHISHLGASS